MRRVFVEGLDVFYREAGPRDAPVLLLLHGLRSCSRRFEPLLRRLGDAFHLVAPDYPHGFAYTSGHLADVIGQFTESLGLTRYTLYMQGCGSAVGFRMAMAHPERVHGLILENAVAHDDGPGPDWSMRCAWRAWLRRTEPRLLVLWSRHDASRQTREAEALRRDVSTAAVHLVDGELDTAADDVAARVRRFMAKEA